MSEPMECEQECVIGIGHDRCFVFCSEIEPNMIMIKFDYCPFCGNETRYM